MLSVVADGRRVRISDAPRTSGSKLLAFSSGLAPVMSGLDGSQPSPLVSLYCLFLTYVSSLSPLLFVSRLLPFQLLCVCDGSLEPVGRREPCTPLLCASRGWGLTRVPLFFFLRGFDYDFRLALPSLFPRLSVNGCNSEVLTFSITVIPGGYIQRSFTTVGHSYPVRFFSTL